MQNCIISHPGQIVSPIVGPVSYFEATVSGIIGSFIQSNNSFFGNCIFSHMTLKCSPESHARAISCLLLWQDLERRSEELEELALLECCFPEAEKQKREMRVQAQVRLSLLCSSLWGLEGTDTDFYLGKLY